MRRKNLFIGLLLVVMFIATTGSAQANLLSNGGFETWVDYEGKNVPAEWMHIFNFTSLTGTQETTIVNGDLSSGKIQTDSTTTAWGGWFQQKPFTAGDTLYAQAYVNVPSAPSFDVAALKVSFLDSGSAVIESLRVEENGATSGWETLNLSGVAPTGTVKIEVGVLMEGWGDGPFSSTIYFDDVYADSVAVPEPASLLLLGSGLVGLFGVSRKKRST